MYSTYWKCRAKRTYRNYLCLVLQMVTISVCVSGTLHFIVLYRLLVMMSFLGPSNVLICKVFYYNCRIWFSLQRTQQIPFFNFCAWCIQTPSTWFVWGFLAIALRKENSKLMTGAHLWRITSYRNFIKIAYLLYMCF